MKWRQINEENILQYIRYFEKVFFCCCGGWRVDVRETDLGDGAVIVANGVKFAELPLSRCNNSTTIINTMKIICIKSQIEDLSDDALD